ncbi:MAG TPA: phosphoribosylglycinamide formyltransferase [Steroidobacteraceae bacterium]
MSAPAKLRLAVLISGRGSNMLSIARHCTDGRIAARIARVIADRPDAAGLASAAKLHLPVAIVPRAAYPDRERFEAALSAQLDNCAAELVVLAGFMRVLSAAFTARFAGRLMNIHPSLLPAYRGLHTHRRALAAGEPRHGASVHFVTTEVDGGPVILQAQVPILATDTEQSLAARVLEREHVIFPQAIGWYADGRLRQQGAFFVLDGQSHSGPIVAS